jgi:hypothetical protein
LIANARICSIFSPIIIYFIGEQDLLHHHAITLSEYADGLTNTTEEQHNLCCTVDITLVIAEATVRLAHVNNFTHEMIINPEKSP